jgi:hypothetical protein
MSKSITDLAFLSQFITEPIFLGKDSSTPTQSHIAETEKAEPLTVVSRQKEETQREIQTITKEHEKPVLKAIPVKYLGSNKSQILVLGFYKEEEHVSTSGLALFEKMYKALHLDIQDFAIVNVAKISGSEFQLPEFKKLLVLGDQAALLLTTPALASLPLKSKNIVVTGGNKKLLWANTFEEIGQMDNVGKKAFWDALRELLA